MQVFFMFFILIGCGMDDAKLIKDSPNTPTKTTSINDTNNDSVEDGESIINELPNIIHQDKDIAFEKEENYVNKAENTLIVEEDVREETEEQVVIDIPSDVFEEEVVEVDKIIEEAFYIGNENLKTFELEISIIWETYSTATHYRLVLTHDIECTDPFLTYNVVLTNNKDIIFSDISEGYVCVQAINTDDNKIKHAKNTGTYFRVGEWELQKDFNYAITESSMIKPENFSTVKDYGIKTTESVSNCFGNTNPDVYLFKDAVMVDYDAEIAIYSNALIQQANCQFDQQ